MRSDQARAVVRAWQRWGCSRVKHLVWWKNSARSCGIAIVINRCWLRCLPLASLEDMPDYCNEGHWFRLMSYAHEHNISGRYGWRESRSSREEYACHLGRGHMPLTPIRCAHCGCKNIESYRTYTIRDGEQRTIYHCSSCQYLRQK